ncbi:MAG: division/cell wall cluster transcriptional repressor MraZ [Rhodospirillales bacterium]|nr:division/cell wall cluster transcriptional repressor MraZ [Rhodospirillales bacterium]
MPLLVGRHLNKIDRKGRVSVPKAFRDSLQAQGTEGMPPLYAYPLFKAPGIEACGEEFMQRIAHSLDDLDMFSDEQDELASVLLESAHLLPFDPEGRVVLPAELITHAGLDGEALFVGRGVRFQIWNPAAYQETRGESFARARSRGATLSLRREQGDL